MSSLSAFRRKKLLSPLPSIKQHQQQLQQKTNEKNPTNQEKQNLSNPSPSLLSSSSKDNVELKVQNPNIRKAESSLDSSDPKIPRRSNRHFKEEPKTQISVSNSDESGYSDNENSSSSLVSLRDLTDNFSELPSTISISSSILSGSWDECSNAEKILRKWDLEIGYGPASGDSRTKRWERAAKLGKNPPYYVIQLLQDGESDKPLWKKYNL